MPISGNVVTELEEQLFKRPGTAFRKPGARTAYIKAGSTRENGNRESFNARFRDEQLNSAVCDKLQEAQILTEQLRKHYKTERPHSDLGNHPPVPETIILMEPGPIMH